MIEAPTIKYLSTSSNCFIITPDFWTNIALGINLTLVGDDQAEPETGSNASSFWSPYMPEIDLSPAALEIGRFLFALTVSRSDSCV